MMWIYAVACIVVIALGCVISWILGFKEGYVEGVKRCRREVK